VIIALEAVAAVTAPAIDGVKEDAWNNAKPMQLRNHLSSRDDGDLITVSAMWDSTYLYIQFEGQDDVVRNDIARADNPWDDDSVEVYLDGNNAKGDSYDADDDQLVFIIGGTKVWSQRGRGTGTEFASSQTEYSFLVEIRIPWAKFSVSPVADQVVGFEAMFNDDDNLNQGLGDGKWALYARQDNAWDKPSVFGELKLLK
jgi:endo-1,4-beta-xylanase